MTQQFEIGHRVRVVNAITSGYIAPTLATVTNVDSEYVYARLDRGGPEYSYLPDQLEIIVEETPEPEKMTWDMESASLQGMTSEHRLIRVSHSMMASAPSLYGATQQDIDTPDYWTQWIDKTPHVWYADDPEETNDELAFHGTNEKHPGLRKVHGPYRVKNIGSDGDVWEVVEMVDNTSNTWQELRPRKTYINRQPAYSKCLRLNQRWQKENMMEDNLLEYWQNATN